jgi:hypothetical protein
MQKDLLTQLLGFVYSAAHYLGVAIVALVQRILPSATNLEMLADPIGFLGILTIFVVLVSVARKVAIIVLIAGWALILVRIVLMAFRVG